MNYWNMKLSWKLRSSVSGHTHMQLLLRLAVAILLMGLAFRLLFFSSQELSSPDLETAPAVAKTDVAEATRPDNFTIDVSEYEDQYLQPEKSNSCDFFELGFCFYFIIPCVMTINELSLLFDVLMFQSPKMRMRCLKKVKK